MKGNFKMKAKKEKGLSLPSELTMGTPLPLVKRTLFIFFVIARACPGLELAYVATSPKATRKKSFTSHALSNCC